jgi:putative phosphoribosyl transferase
MFFEDRVDAGRRLGSALRHLASADTVVVGLPRGGVPVAFHVARALGAPLDVIVVRKLGVPFQPELGMGAIGEGGVRIINTEVVDVAGVSDHEIADVEYRERAELARRARRFRGGRAPVPLSGRTVIVVDDGIATGSTARAACQVARAQGAARVVLAVPVGPPDVQRLRSDADEVVCLCTPPDFVAIGQFYRDFTQVRDDEVVELLRRAGEQPADWHRAVAVDPPGVDEDVRLQLGRALLGGHRTIPDGVHGIVVFAHGSGSSRHSPRNRYVANVLNATGLATLLFDLLSVEEESRRANVFDIDLLGRRLLEITAWLGTRPDTMLLPVGYFGASTGAGAALWAAADPDADVAAVVSRGGRPDLAAPRLGEVRAPTLLIVGGRDNVVIDLNRFAETQLRCEKRLAIVPGATHLFEEPGALEQVAQLAAAWFTRHLALAPTGRGG